jgi:hypothetical protein
MNEEVGISQCVFVRQTYLIAITFQLSKALKDLPNRVLNVAVEERAELFQDVTNILTNPGWITFFSLSLNTSSKFCNLFFQA